MRFQGVSPDSLSRFRSPSRTEDQIFSQYYTGGGDGDGGGAPPQSKTNGGGANGNGSGGDMLLQWGQRKRSSRTESRQTVGPTTTTDDSSSSSSTQFHGSLKKVQRRVVVMVDKQKRPSINGGTNTNTNTMPPPPPSLVPCSTYNGRANLKPPCAKDSIAFSPNWRNSEERSAGGNGSPPSHSGRDGRPVSPRSRVAKRSPTPNPNPKDKYDNSNINNPTSSASASLRNDKFKNGMNSIHHHHHHQEPSQLVTINDHIIHSSAQPHLGPEAAVTDHDDYAKTGKEPVNGAAGDGGVAGSVNVWPRIYIPLTRKEKEEDFLAMKGTKLPHRPKKRPKAVERVLQYCYPGMWLGDVTRARYEVKEKKSSKKRRRGLKGMESMESDSDQ